MTINTTITSTMPTHAATLIRLSFSAWRSKAAGDNVEGPGMEAWLLGHGFSPLGTDGWLSNPDSLEPYVCYVSEKCPNLTTYAAMNNAGTWSGGGPFYPDFRDSSCPEAFE